MGLLGFLVLVLGISSVAYGAISQLEFTKLSSINAKGPYIGIVSPNAYELNPLLQLPSYVVDDKVPYIDFAGKRFRIGKLENQKVIIVMSGLSLINAGISTQLLLSLFNIKGVVHHGIAGNANPAFNIGDVTIPQYWAHSGLWYWQRFGDGPDDELSLESSGDYTRTIGYLNISSYNNYTKSVPNLLNKVWYQPEEIFPVNGTPEVRQHAFWVQVGKTYFEIAKKLEDMKLNACVNTTCLPRNPRVARVKTGLSASVFVDNSAYREFLYSKFNVTPVDMESAAVALVCLQQRKPFITIRALSDLAGGGSEVSNEAATYASLASQNSVEVLRKFFSLLE